MLAIFDNTHEVGVCDRKSEYRVKSALRWLVSSFSHWPRSSQCQWWMLRCLLTWSLVFCTPWQHGLDPHCNSKHQESLTVKSRDWLLWHPEVKVKVDQLCPTLCDPMDYTVHGILQARILEWVAFPFSRGSSRPRNRTGVSCTAGRFFTSWATTVKSSLGPLMLLLLCPVIIRTVGRQCRVSVAWWSQISFQ